MHKNENKCENKNQFFNLQMVFLIYYNMNKSLLFLHNSKNGKDVIVAHE